MHPVAIIASKSSASRSAFNTSSICGIRQVVLCHISTPCYKCYVELRISQRYPSTISINETTVKTNEVFYPLLR